MNKLVPFAILPMLFLVSAVLLAIEPPPVWRTEPIDHWRMPGAPEPAKAANVTPISPYTCSVLGPRIDWG